MSTTSKRSKRPKLDIARPFDPGILARAKEIAAAYQISVWFEDGEYYGRGLELPMTFGDGKTPDECFASTREGLVTTVAYMLEQGETPPPPALVSDEQRTEQINLRVSASEK